MANADIVAGITHIWDNNFTEAEKIFGGESKVSPRHALHYAEVAFLRSFITADTADTEESIKRLKHAKNLAEDHIEAFKKGVAPTGVTVADKKDHDNKSLDARVVLGDSLYMLAVLQLTRDSKLKGALNMRKSWKVFEDGLKMAKEREDAYDPELVRCLNFGAGFFFFAMSIIPQKFLKLIELVGFKADRDLGLKYIHDCHDTGGIRAPFATMVLLFNNLLLPRGLANPAKYLREADALIKESLAKYPNGSLFQVMGSHCARKQTDVDEGIRCMEVAIENCRTTLNAAPLIYKYELANCFAMKMNWAAAVAEFEPLVETEKFQVRTVCGVQLACCYIMLGQTDKAMAMFNRVPSFVKKSSSVDPMIANQAKRYMQNGGHFAAFELLYLRRDLVKMERNMSEAMSLLESQAAKAQGALTPFDVSTIQKKNLLTKGLASLSFGKSKKEEVIDWSADNRAAYQLLKGSMLKAMGKADEAIKCFNEVITLQDAVREKWYVPYCLFELGESHYHKGNLKEAQDLMKKCNNLDGYDYSDPLKIKLRVTIDQLKKGGVMDDNDADGAEASPATSPNDVHTPTPVAAES